MSARGERREFLDAEQRFATHAAAHVAPEHVDRALSHVAQAMGRALDEGRLTGEQLDAMTDADHRAVYAQLAKDNPQIARAPLAPKARRPSLHEAQAAALKRRPWI